MYSLSATRAETRVVINAESRSASPSSLSCLFRDQPVEMLEPGVAALWQGDEAAHVFEVVEGVMRVFKVLADGRRVITGFMYPGDLMGVSDGARYLYTAEAVNKVKVRRYSRARFEDQVAASPELRSLIFAHLRDEMAAAQDQMVLLACKRAEERVSTHLIRIAQRRDGIAASGVRVEIPMARADMADYLGLTLETVSRIMSRLVALGVIAHTSRHTIEIRNCAKLARLAGECDGQPASLREARTALN